MPFSKPCRRCGKSIKNRTKFQTICIDCKRKIGRKRKLVKKNKKKHNIYNSDIIGRVLEIDVLKSMLKMEKVKK